MKATTKDAYQLMHQGAIALAQVEANGLRIDTEYLDSAISKVSIEIDKLNQKLKEDKIFKIWKRRYGSKTKLGSYEQLGRVLFETMKLPYPHGELPKRPRSDEETIETVGLPFVTNWIKVRKLSKLRSTNLIGIKKELSGDLLRPFQNLHIARSYRSSQDSPNGQNIPNRDEELAKWVRTAFIPRKNHVLAEFDFKGAEVCLSACYHHDPNMIAYIKDTSTDMHRDVSTQLYKLKKKQVSKPIRSSTKGNFVFAQFYGSWYKSCAPRLWKDISRMDLQTADGVGLLDVLAEQGIIELGDMDDREPETGTFAERVWKVEKDFWGKRFKVYDQWRRDWYDSYLKVGHFDMLTGFRCSGVFTKNEATNFPIQGSAFHCLLWCLIQLNRWLRKNKMRSMIIGQIHDSCILDVHKKEFDDVCNMAQDLIVHKLPKNWPWIIVPLIVEIEGSNENWFNKQPCTNKSGKWELGKDGEK